MPAPASLVSYLHLSIYLIDIQVHNSSVIDPQRTAIMHHFSNEVNRPRLVGHTSIREIVEMLHDSVLYKCTIDIDIYIYTGNSVQLIGWESTLTFETQVRTTQLSDT